MIRNGIIQLDSIKEIPFYVSLIPTSNKTSRPQIPMTPRFITIHNTGNSKQNADAEMHTKYVDTVCGYISWHFTVDDKGIYQELPINEIGYHAGDGSGDGNFKSIGIEICENVDGNWKKARANGIKLIQWLLENVITLASERIVPHKHWSGKYCPHKILDEGWDEFINDLKKEDTNMGWQQETGIKAIESLNVKGKLDDVEGWSAKDLTEETPLWLFFLMMDRITSTTEKKTPIKPTEPVEKKYIIVTTDALNVRDDVNGNLLGVVHNGNKLLVLDEKSGWYKIIFGTLTGWVHGGYIKKYKKPNENYHTIKKYDSLVHIFEANQKDFIVDVSLGEFGKLEKLSNIKPNPSKEKYANKDIIAKINAQFFDPKGSTEAIGTLVDEGFYYKPPSDSFIDLIYYKDGTTEIKRIKDLKEVVSLQSKTNWVIGTSWALVIGGVKNTLNKDKFGHSSQRHPRTLLGQKKDGTWLLVVIDGRGRNNSKGMTANQCSELMFDLGCFNAVNLDGGGSSEMIVNDTIMNCPTDGVERRVGSSILVYKK